MTSVQGHCARNWRSTRYEGPNPLLSNFQYIQNILAHLLGGQVLHHWPGRKGEMTPHVYNHLEQFVRAKMFEGHLPQLTFLRHI